MCGAGTFFDLPVIKATMLLAATTMKLIVQCLLKSKCEGRVLLDLGLPEVTLEDSRDVLAGIADTVGFLHVFLRHEHAH